MDGSGPFSWELGQYIVYVELRRVPPIVQNLQHPSAYILPNLRPEIVEEKG